MQERLRFFYFLLQNLFDNMEVFDISESPEKEEEVESVMDDLEVKNILKTNDKVRLIVHWSLLFQMTVAIYCTTHALTISTPVVDFSFEL